MILVGFNFKEEGLMSPFPRRMFLFPTSIGVTWYSLLPVCSGGHLLRAPSYTDSECTDGCLIDMFFLETTPRTQNQPPARFCEVRQWLLTADSKRCSHS